MSDNKNREQRPSGGGGDAHQNGRGQNDDSVCSKEKALDLCREYLQGPWKVIGIDQFNFQRIR